MARASAESKGESGTPHEIIAGRYSKLAELGGGGMAVVYAVVDHVTGRRVALKRPRVDGSSETRKRSVELFAREFHTLVQLAHPRIVAVYDYRVDEYGPMYTMEILDGGDLQDLTPVDYRRACAIASDVCSALSLLHSRRIIHRDVSPRNIRCTSEGLAKLIDFGAMTPMGPSKELVGTPGYCAPEVLHMQTLDGRTDLFALGASLYYALTGHHAYPARDFSSLPNVWQFAVARPSERVAGIPEALDALVLDLLQLRPEDRPSNTAEVMARLSAITGTSQGEQLIVAQAYLATPAFVGREEELAQIKLRTTRALQQRGAALLIEGATGSGRSRLLDAALLDSKVTGLTVVRADASDGETEYGVVRRLLLQLHQLIPETLCLVTKPVLSTLAQIVPELAPKTATPDASPALRPQLQSALQTVLLGVAQRTPLLLAVDDLDAIDEPSTAAIALVAQQVRHSTLVILATASTNTTPLAAKAFQLFRQAAKTVPLRNLSEAETQTLFTSVFGASRALPALAQRLHALSAGSPRDLMRFAQHLVDIGRARYHGGMWSLPSNLAATELPASVSQMLVSRLQLLATPALDLARVLGLCPDRSFSFEECRVLSERDEPGAVLSDIEHLTQSEVIRLTGDRVALSDRAWVALLRAGLSSAHERALHLRLAQVFEARGRDDFRHAQHLLRAGEVERALDRFVAHATSSREQTDRNSEAFHQLLLALPEDWLQTYELVLSYLRERGPAKRAEFAVLTRLTSLAAMAGIGGDHQTTLVQQLADACGLSDWQQLDPALEPAMRLQRAFGQAQARYAAAPEAERFTDPATAIRELATSLRAVIGFAAISLDSQLGKDVPSLEPLFPIAPALALSEQIVRGVQARLCARIDRARESYRTILNALAVPESTGLPPTYVEYTRLIILNGISVLDAACGLPCLEAADEIEKHPTLRSNAWLVRMLHHLWQGNSHEAELCRKQFDLARIQSSASQIYESTHVPWQVIAYAAMDDLTRLKRSLDEVAPLAQQYPGFQPLLAYGQAEYQRIRGDSASARTVLEQLIGTWDVGTHQIWPQLAAAHVRALDESGESARAIERGQAYLAAAARAELGVSSTRWIQLTLCVAQAKLKHPEAEHTAEHVIEGCLENNVSGLILGLAHEARAQVALLLEDADGYDYHRTMCEREFAKAANPALSSKLQRLKRSAQRRNLISQAPLLETSQQTGMERTVESRLGTCHGAQERATAMLGLLAQHSGATEGHLFLVRDGSPSWTATIGARDPDDQLHAMARDYVASELHGGSQVTGESTGLSVASDWTAAGESGYRPVVLSHYTGGDCVVTGLAVLVPAPGRQFVYPGEVATLISRLAQSAGDVTGMVVHDE